MLFIQYALRNHGKEVLLGHVRNVRRDAFMVGSIEIIIQKGGEKANV